jgi:formylglycine-generating enzyme required for sulfatase activity
MYGQTIGIKTNSLDNLIVQLKKGLPVSSLTKLSHKMGVSENKLAITVTEAHWEYACRAGTSTPFHFGETISTDQANFDGNYPYNKGDKGKYREQTVPVQSLACNDWGLYEMHGNVWEWCADWYGGYPQSSVVDPIGPETGAGRVLRGGSWFNDGRFVRSADRGRDVPAHRLPNFSTA